MSGDASEKSLAELCSVCYTAQPKYRCPRCTTQTCSLPCYKRHQQRASCNGQRDPAAYLRKSEWATPTGIDRDYNYLKTVERRVETGTKDLSERGINGRNPNRSHGKTGDGRVAKSWAPGSALQRYLGENGIRVERAPVGMSRSKANRTRVTPKGKVMWTSEWVEGDGERKGEKKSIDESSEARTIGELWEEVVARRVNSEARGMGRKRKRGEGGDVKQEDGIGVKRKSSTIEADAAAKVEELLPQSGLKTEISAADYDRNAHGSEVTVKQENAETNSTEHEDAQPEYTKLKDLKQENVKREYDEQDDNKQDDNQREPIQPETTKPDNSQDHPAASSQPTETLPPQQKHFYLEKPLTASSARTLIPIPTISTLTASLSSRTVLEYPTFYVFSCGPEDLPEGFQLEEEYLKARKAESREVEGLLAQTGGQEGMWNDGQREEGGRGVDVEGILSMLARDVGA